MNYNIWNLFKKGLSENSRWPAIWNNHELNKSYDVIVVGGGGHGLATAYYLASRYNVKNIAVLEKSIIGLGNVARNTTIVRSNYLWDESSAIYEHSLKLWEGLSKDLGYNVMFSQRAVYSLAHNLQDIRALERRNNANLLNGIDSEIITPEQLKKQVPYLNTSKSSRYPILGASVQKRAGVARHDAVTWGYAHAASKLGVHIIQNCEVQQIITQNNRVTKLITSKGDVKTDKLALVVTGGTTQLADTVNIRLPLSCHPLQAFVSEPLKPILDTVIMSNAVHGYISQTNKGDLVIGAGIDSYNGFSQRGSPHVIEHNARAIVELFPVFSRVRMNRQWAGTVDITPDACPIISKTKVSGLYINAGWGTGGFKATPGSGDVFAATIANDHPHELAKPFDLSRFVTGHKIDEHGAAGVAH